MYRRYLAWSRFLNIFRLHSPCPTGSIHLNSIVLLWLRETRRVTGFNRDQANPTLSLDLSRIRYKHDSAKFNQEGYEKLPNQVTQYSRKFHITDTLITNGENQCNVLVQLRDSMIFDATTAEHFTCTGQHTTLIEPITGITTLRGAGYRTFPSQPVFKASGTWTVRTKLTGRVYISAKDQYGRGMNNEGDIQEILRYVADLGYGYERLCEDDWDGMKIVSSGSYEVVAPKQ